MRWGLKESQPLEMMFSGQCQLPTTNYQLLTTNYQLLFANCLLPRPQPSIKLLQRLTHCFGQSSNADPEPVRRIEEPSGDHTGLKLPAQKLTEFFGVAFSQVWKY